MSEALTRTAPLLGRAEWSSPKAAYRRAEGAGLDGEGADRAIIGAVVSSCCSRKAVAEQDGKLAQGGGPLDGSPPAQSGIPDCQVTLGKLPGVLVILRPRSQEDLFKLALARLDDIKLDLEEGDESEASLLRRVQSEVELRKVIANRLRFSAAGKYTTGSEEELADATRTDIRLHHPEVEARIPIELKIADAAHWSARTLREKLEEQLSEQYLREARYGIYLLVRRGAVNDRRDWRHAELDRIFNFSQLAAWLQEEAHTLVRANPSIDGLAVIAIDLTRRDERL